MATTATGPTPLHSTEPHVMRPDPTLVDGLLLVDKPAGVTSHDVVARVRRSQRTRRVGHAGTLDPFATGLLVCAVGQATRLLPYVYGEPKVYRTRIAFGRATDTDDSTGTEIAQGPLPDWSRLAEALASLTGPLLQVPPAYSAKHVDGERAYAKARRGEAVALPPVAITVHAWDERARGDEWLDVEIRCSGGTYIRALARDLGPALGTVAHCASLRRVASGPLLVEQAVSFDALAPGAMLPLTSARLAMPHLPAQTLTAEELRDVRLGRTIAASVAGAMAVLVREETGHIVAVAERVQRHAGAAWQPRVVLGDAESTT
jgi:tRNA pseudouridine55 synthase